MSAATLEYSRNPRTRYEGGFDRWSFEARAGWAMLWRGSDHASYALSENRAVWVWDEDGRIWSRLPGDEANTVYREHELTMRRLRRAVLVVKLLNSRVEGERAAARAALQRIGTAIASDWQSAPTGQTRSRGVSWFDHPAAVYLAVTQDCRFHLRERERMDFDPAVFAEMVAGAQEDFKAGRRAEPPRLRPVDLVHLQAGGTHAAARPAGKSTPIVEESGTENLDRGDQMQPDGPDPLGDLREAVADEVERELHNEDAARRKRRRLWLISGSVAASLALLLGFVTYL